MADNKQNYYDEGSLFKLSKSTVGCSKHFTDADYKKTPVRKTLKPGTVPAGFDWSNKKVPRRALKRNVLAERDRNNDNKMVRTDGEQEHEEYEFQAESEAAVQDTMISELEQKLLEKEEECVALKRQRETERFGIQRFSSDSSMISFYMGFTSYITFTTSTNMANLLKGTTLRRGNFRETIAISWKQGSFLGLGGDRGQSYNVYEYLGPNGSTVPIFIQSGWDAPAGLLVDSRLQYGMNDGTFFFVLHDKSQTPYQHRFIQNFIQRSLYTGNSYLRAVTGGKVDAAWIVGDYLRDF